jgi:hypothetical protein
LARAGPDLNLWHAAHRMMLLDPRAAEKLRSLSLLSPEAQDIVLAVAQTASKNFHLSHLTGRAFARGLFRWKNDRNEEHEGVELLQAGDVYAALHRQVWGKLPADIEAALVERYGHDAFNLLLEVGRVRGPSPPASHFRKLVGETPAPPGETDPAEYLTRRLRQADRFGAGRAALYGRTGEFQRRGAVVENIVIWAIEPTFLRVGEMRTARSVDDQGAFVSGLRALAEHFELFDRRERGDRPAKGGEPT